MRFFRKRRRRALEGAALDAASQTIVARNLLVHDLLPETDLRELEGKARVLLEEKSFEGCGGLDLTDEPFMTKLAQVFD